MILADEAYDPSTHALEDVYWTVADRQGSVRDVLTFNGTHASVHEQISYDAYGRIAAVYNGNTLDTSLTPSVVYAYTGREWDAAIEMQYSRERWFIPELGKWANKDPIGFEAGDANLYRYVGNSPTNYRDPTGLSASPTSHAEFQSLVMGIDKLVKDDVISECQAFAYLFGELYEMKKRDFNITLHDAIIYFVSPDLEGQFQVNNRRLISEGSRSKAFGDWKPPSWLNRHDSQSPDKGYRCEKNDSDVSGRHAHLIGGMVVYAMGGILGYAMQSASAKDTPTDLLLEKKGSLIAAGILHAQDGVFFGNPYSGDALAQSIYEAVCNEGDCKAKNKGFLSKKKIDGLLQQ